MASMAGIKDRIPRLRSRRLAGKYWERRDGRK